MSRLQNLTEVVATFDIHFEQVCVRYSVQIFIKQEIQQKIAFRTTFKNNYWCNRNLFRNLLKVDETFNSAHVAAYSTQISIALLDKLTKT